MKLLFLLIFCGLYGLQFRISHLHIDIFTDNDNDMRVREIIIISIKQHHSKRNWFYEEFKVIIKLMPWPWKGLGEGSEMFTPIRSFIALSFFLASLLMPVSIGFFSSMMEFFSRWSCGQDMPPKEYFHITSRQPYQSCWNWTYFLCIYIPTVPDKALISRSPTVSRTGHQISRIKWTFKLFYAFCLKLSPCFPLKIWTFCIHCVVWDIFAHIKLSHWQR